MSSLRTAICVAILAASTAALPLRAQDTASSRTAASAEALQQVIDRQNALIERLATRVEELEARVADLEQPEPAGPGTASRVAVDDLTDAAALQLSEEERREQERLIRTAFQSTLIERSGLLLPPKTVDVETSLNYTHSSADNILIDGFSILPVLVVGDIVSEKVEREITTAALTLRAGLPWDTQVDVRVPYGYYQQRSFQADSTETGEHDWGLGDVTIGLSHQFLRGAGPWPDLLGSVRWKTTSGRSPFEVSDNNPVALGSGYDSVNFGITGVKVIDPVVYFGAVNYSANLATSEDIGRFNPGNSIGFSLGMAIALNLNSSLSFSYDQQFTQRSRLDGQEVPGSYLTTGTFTVGGSIAISDSLTADLSLGIGVTEDSPDIQLGASLPLRLRF
ncbi:MAG: hypothetical protein U5Q16_12035 [Gammaproteobacteria bacterium]|nr:hypothetical protein [Gammaproteobacteria bacterium]